MERSGLRSHLSGSLPISIAVHLVAVLLCLIIPLTASIELPDPAWHVPDYMPVAPAPPPPVARVPSATAPTPNAATNPDLAPTSAPDAIKPEAALPGPPDLGLPPGAGVPEGLGIIATDKPVAMQAPEPPRPAVPVRVADLPVSPRKIVDVRPAYPEIARAARVEGTVIMEAVLDTNGRVTQLRVLKTVPMLEQAAVDAVRQWRYTPSSYGGHPVSVLMTITVRFALQ
jgi:periplasmic protein TonB